MQVYELPRGERAPQGSDRVSIERTARGEYTVSGVVAHSRIAIFVAPPESFKTEKEALEAALAFAHKNGAENLVVERPDADRT